MALNVWISGKCPSATPSLGSSVALFVVVTMRLVKPRGCGLLGSCRIYSLVTGENNRMPEGGRRVVSQQFFFQLLPVIYIFPVRMAGGETQHTTTEDDPCTAV